MAKYVGINWKGVKKAQKMAPYSEERFYNSK